MTGDPHDIRRYFRQLAELGGSDLYLNTIEAQDALRLAAGLSRPARADSKQRDAPAAQSSAAAPPAAPPGPAVPRRTAAPGALATLQSMAADAADCTRCRLHAERQRAVFGEGDAAADVAVVGEAPGQEEDRSGRPFVGRAGRMLDLLLLSAGYPRETVYICNVLKCRPPGNRNPLPDEVDACTSHFLHDQLATIAPQAILAVGRFAIQTLLGTDDAIGRLRGRVHAYRGTPVVVSYHPAYLLRSPQMARAAWDDLQLLRAVLDEPV